MRSEGLVLGPGLPQHNTGWCRLLPALACFLLLPLVQCGSAGEVSGCDRIAVPYTAPLVSPPLPELGARLLPFPSLPEG